LGFSATDIGFILFPQTGKASLDISTNLNKESLQNFAVSFKDQVTDELLNNAYAGSADVWMPNTCIRLGVALTPGKKEIFTWATDISISDLNRLLLGGYPSFNVSTGIEVKPGYKWFALPMRLAFNYNSQANVPSFSLGLGIYLGPVEMELAVKGLEILIQEWGAKEVSAGFDFKFEF
jgi:hypothetical protein